MSDQLDIDATIQRMIDAGESEENIGTFYQAMMAEQSDVKPVAKSQAGMGQDPIANLINKVSPGTGDYLEGAAQGMREGVIGGAKGFVKGIVPGAVSAVTGAPGAIFRLGKGAIDAAVGGYNMVTDPVKTSKGAIDSIATIPGKIKDAASAAATKAAVDPEGFGNDVGQMTGGTAAGIGMGRVLPMAPKPIARKLGSFVEQVGQQGKWPIRMMGAHQLGSGNPAGLATITMPEVLTKTGRSLQEFGAPPSQATWKKNPDPMPPTGGAPAPPPPPGASLPGYPRGGASPAPAPVAPAAPPARAGAAPGEGFGSRKLPNTKADKINESSSPMMDSLMDDLYGDGPLPQINPMGHGTMKAEAPAAASRPRQVKTDNPELHTKSKKPQTKNKGFTDDELVAEGYDPKIKYSAFPPARLERMLARRAEAAKAHYGAAREAKAARQATILEDALLDKLK
jgi:hypothetical protein